MIRIYSNQSINRIIYFIHEILLKNIIDGTTLLIKDYDYKISIILSRDFNLNFASKQLLFLITFSQLNLKVSSYPTKKNKIKNMHYFKDILIELKKIFDFTCFVSKI